MQSERSKGANSRPPRSGLAKRSSSPSRLSSIGLIADRNAMRSSGAPRSKRKRERDGRRKAENGSKGKKMTPELHRKGPPSSNMKYVSFALRKRGERH